METIDILHAILKKQYEKFHNDQYTDQALQSAMNHDKTYSRTLPVEAIRCD